MNPAGHLFVVERGVAVAAVARACRLTAAVRAHLDDGAAMLKSDRTPVTIADLGAQALVCDALAQHFPEDPIAAEEDLAELGSAHGLALRARAAEEVGALFPEMAAARIEAALAHGGFGGGPRGRFWTLDPLDGTKGFLRGGQYAVALALIEDGAVVLGVLGCPNLPRSDGESGGSMYVAVRGGGAWTLRIDPADGDAARRISVAGHGDGDGAALRFCEPVEAEHSAQGEAARVAGALGVSAPPLRMDSQCKYAMVARGSVALYLRLPTSAGYEEKIWDHAAGALLVEEAGGRVSDVSGAALDFSAGRTLRRNRGVVATNGALHPRALEALRPGSPLVR